MKKEERTKRRELFAVTEFFLFSSYDEIVTPNLHRNICFLCVCPRLFITTNVGIWQKRKLRRIWRMRRNLSFWPVPEGGTIFCACAKSKYKLGRSRQSVLSVIISSRR